MTYCRITLEQGSSSKSGVRECKTDKSYENGNNLCQNFFHERCWQGIHFTSMPSCQINYSRLIATYNTGSLDSRYGYGKTKTASGLPPLVIGKITGNLMASLNSAGDTAKTERLPLCSCPADRSSDMR